MRTYIGVDLHLKHMTYHIIQRNSTKKIMRSFGKVTMTELDSKFLPLLTNDTYICIEACTYSYGFIKRLKGTNANIIVIHPYSFNNSYVGKKTDRIDAKLLANRLKIHIEDNDPEDGFPEVYIPDEEVQQLRRLFSTYNYITKEISSLKNRIRSYFHAQFISMSRKTLLSQFDHFLSVGSFNDIDKMQLQFLKQQVDMLSVQKNTVKNMILKIGYNKFTEEIHILLTIPGISAFSACALMTDVVTLSRFSNAKNFASYLRSVPRVANSGETKRNGHINKAGRKSSFQFLLQGINHFKNSNPVMIDFYNRKTKGKCKSKVRAAMIRKMIVTVFYMLKNKELYRFGNEQLYQKKIKELLKMKQNDMVAA